MRGSTSTPNIAPKWRASSAICWISSRVGAMIRACSCCTSTWMRCNSGNKNASVLPVPVWALAITSCPLKMRGIDFSWIGVGSFTPTFCNACISSGTMPKD